MKPNVNYRNDEKLATSATRLQSDMKAVHGKYSDLVSDLAIYTKSELKPLIASAAEKAVNEDVKSSASGVFEKIESVLIEMDEAFVEMGEILQVMGGLEFATNNTVDKLSQILRDQESQQARMAKELGMLEKEFNNGSTASDSLADGIRDFQIEFSRLQDHVIASVPRLTRVFDELDNEERAGEKYGKSL